MRQLTHQKRPYCILSESGQNVHFHFCKVPVNSLARQSKSPSLFRHLFILPSIPKSNDDPQNSYFATLLKKQRTKSYFY